MYQKKINNIAVVAKHQEREKNCSIGSGCLREINIGHIVKRKKLSLRKRMREELLTHAGVP